MGYFALGYNVASPPMFIDHSFRRWKHMMLNYIKSINYDMGSLFENNENINLYDNEVKSLNDKTLEIIQNALIGSKYENLNSYVYASQLWNDIENFENCGGFVQNDILCVNNNSCNKYIDTCIIDAKINEEPCLNLEFNHSCSTNENKNNNDESYNENDDTCSSSDSSEYSNDKINEEQSISLHEIKLLKQKILNLKNENSFLKKENSILKDKSFQEKGTYVDSSFHNKDLYNFQNELDKLHVRSCALNKKLIEISHDMNKLHALCDQLRDCTITCNILKIDSLACLNVNIDSLISNC